MIVLLFLAPAVVAAYLLGRRRGAVKAIDELWPTAMALGAYGQVLRDQAAVCTPETWPGQSGQFCAVHFHPWPCDQ